MIVILKRERFDEYSDVVDELIIDTKDWYLSKRGNTYQLRNVHDPKTLYLLSEAGYETVTSAMIRGET